MYVGLLKQAYRANKIEEFDNYLLGTNVLRNMPGRKAKKELTTCETDEAFIPT